MYLTDYHTHSICSPDGTVPISQMAAAAKAAGLREMCITDHCDLLDLNGQRTLTFDWSDILAQYRQARRLEDGSFTLRLGLELGGAHVSPTHAAAILKAGDPDFVIGSVHNKSEALGGGDFYFEQYDSPEFCHEMLSDYFSSLLEVARLGLYDSLGHIIYPLRYMVMRDGQQVSLEPPPAGAAGDLHRRAGPGPGGGSEHLPGAHRGRLAGHPGAVPGDGGRKGHRGVRRPPPGGCGAGRDGGHGPAAGAGFPGGHRLPPAGAPGHPSVRDQTIRKGGIQIMKISMGCDHGGYPLKEFLKSWLEEQGHTVVDCGTHSTDSCDYPDFGAAAAREVAEGRCERGIVICTTGIGISIAANKVKGIRCALCSDPLSAEMTRRHNDANMLAMGAGMIGKNMAQRITEVFLTTGFEGGRHQRRVERISALEV